MNEHFVLPATVWGTGQARFLAGLTRTDYQPDLVAARQTMVLFYILRLGPSRVLVSRSHSRREAQGSSTSHGCSEGQWRGRNMKCISAGDDGRDRGMVAAQASGQWRGRNMKCR